LIVLEALSAENKIMNLLYQTEKLSRGEIFFWINFREIQKIRGIQKISRDKEIRKQGA